MAFEKLFEPLRIGSVEIKNRYGLAPFNSIFNDWTGQVSDEDIAALVARAKGGAGLIIVGSALVTELGKKVAPHPWLFITGIEYVPRLALLAENIHLCGAKAFIQILPTAGSRTRPWSGAQPVAPSAGVTYVEKLDQSRSGAQAIFAKRLPGKWLKERYMSPYPEPRVLTEEEIHNIIKETAQNAKLAVLAGYDGIEVHACHHYILDQFRDPRFNKRKDRYGGSRENRNRFLVELMDAVTRSVKEERSDFAVGVRVGGECGGEGGYTFDDTKWLAGQLQEIPIDFWHTTMGLPPLPEVETDSKQDGGHIRWSRELKKILKIPVLTPSIHSPYLAEEAVAKGWTDMVTLCRPLFADPELPNKVKENRVQDINVCKKDSYCWVAEMLCLPLRCSVNPEFGREKYNPKYHIREGFKESLPYVLRQPSK